MSTRNNLSDYRTVRLNATLSPVTEYEAELYAKYGLDPVQVEAYTPDEVIPHVAEADAIIVVSADLPTEVINSLSRCRIISRRGTGTDKIDVASATERGILVTNVPYFCVEEMADHSMALLLALVRKLPQMSETMARGAWSESRQLARTNQRLVGRTLGLIGFGNSAQAMARRAKGFGLRVIATRRRLDAPSPEAEALGVEMVDLDTALRESDYVSLHLPLTDKSYHMLDEKTLRRMKPTAYLINTSRGAIVDEFALAKLIREGQLAGAGIDTFEHIDPFTEEEEPPDHPFLDLDNVILTPHVASASVQAHADVAKGAVDNVVAVLTGRWPEPDNIVNPSVEPWFPLNGREPEGR